MKFKFLKKTTLLSVTSLCALIITSYLQAQYSGFDLSGYKTISLEDEPIAQDLNSLSDAINTNNFDQVIQLIETKKILAKSDDSQGISFVKKAFEAFEERKFVDPRILIYLVIMGAEIPAQVGYAMDLAVIDFKFQATGFGEPNSQNLNKFIHQLIQAAREINPTQKAELLYDAIFYASPFFTEPVEKTSQYQTDYGSIKIRTEFFGKDTTTLEAINLLKEKVLEEYGVEDIADREEEGFIFLDTTQADEDEDFVMIEDTQETKKKNDDEFSIIELDEDEGLSDWVEIGKETEEYQWPQDPSWWEKVKSKFNK